MPKNKNLEHKFKHIQLSCGGKTTINQQIKNLNNNPHYNSY